MRANSPKCPGGLRSGCTVVTTLATLVLSAGVHVCACVRVCSVSVCACVCVWFRVSAFVSRCVSLCVRVCVCVSLLCNPTSEFDVMCMFRVRLLVPVFCDRECAWMCAWCACQSVRLPVWVSVCVNVCVSVCMSVCLRILGGRVEQRESLDAMFLAFPCLVPCLVP